MSKKAIVYWAICVLWIGIGVGKAASLFPGARVAVVLTVCAAFFCAGIFFTLGVRGWRQQKEQKSA